MWLVEKQVYLAVRLNTYFSSSLLSYHNSEFTLEGSYFLRENKISRWL